RRALPKDLPPKSTVYDYIIYRGLRRHSIASTMHSMLPAASRRNAKRVLAADLSSRSQAILSLSKATPKSITLGDAAPVHLCALVQICALAPSSSSHCFRP